MARRLQESHASRDDIAGLAKPADLEATAALRRYVEKGKDRQARYFALALGLLGYEEAKHTLREILATSRRRPVLLTQCAIALGLLGDKETSLTLVGHMQASSSIMVQAALAQAVGFIGDRRSVEPLIKMLENDELQDLPRAFAAVAMGLVGDKEPLPWNSKIAVGANYRANVATLTDGVASGILDFL